MKITVKLVAADNVVITKSIQDVDYISVGKHSLSYRQKGKEAWIHNIPFSSVQNIRIDEV